MSTTTGTRGPTPSLTVKKVTFQSGNRDKTTPWKNLPPVALAGTIPHLSRWELLKELLSHRCIELTLWKVPSPRIEEVNNTSVIVYYEYVYMYSLTWVLYTKYETKYYVMIKWIKQRVEQDPPWKLSRKSNESTGILYVDSHTTQKKLWKKEQSCYYLVER